MGKNKANPALREQLAAIGRKGGAVRGGRKARASRKNLEKAVKVLKEKRNGTTRRGWG